MVEDEGHFQVTCVLYPVLNWKGICYKNAVEAIKLSDLIVNVVSDLVKSWGGGKWNLYVFYSTEEHPESWSGEI